MFEDAIDKGLAELENSSTAVQDSVFRAMYPNCTEEDVAEMYRAEEQLRAETDLQKEMFAQLDQETGAAKQMWAENAMINDQLDGGSQMYSSFTTNSMQNKDYNYQRVKELTHDVAHFDSAEQAVVNMANKAKAREEAPELMQPEEALAYARELGVEIKVDKPTSQGEIQYMVQMEQRRKELTEELVKYQANGDYSALQRLMLTGSMLSGAVGFWETASMVGTSWLGGYGIAAGMGKLAIMSQRANSISKGVKLAKSMMLAEKVARTTTNSAQKIAQAAKTAAAIERNLKKSDFATKVAYDSFRFGKQMGGNRASLLSTMVPFAVDGAVTTALPAVAKEYGDRAMGTDHYTTKDALVEIGLGTAVGGALPVAGTLIKGTASQAGKLISKAQDHISAKQNARISEAIAKGHDAVIEQAEKDGVILNDQMKEVIRIADENNRMSPQVYDNIVQLAGANLTDDEMSTMLTMYLSALKNGTSLAFVDSLPFKYKYYSNIPGMLDSMRGAARSEMTADDFFKLLDERQIAVQTNKVSDTSMVDRVKSGSVGFGVKIGAEGGAMGRTFAHGLTEQEAKEFWYNCHLARMCDEGDTLEAGINAGLKAEESIDRLRAIKSQIDMIVRQNDMINRENDLARAAGQQPVYRYSQQQTMYVGKDGTPCSLEQAIFDLVDMLVPGSDDAAKRLAEANELFDTTGRGVLSAEEKAGLEASVAERQNAIAEIANVLAGHEKGRYDENMYYNLKAIEGGTKERTARLKQLSADFEQMIRENEELLNTDRIFMQNTEAPEEILKKIQGKEDIPELSYSYDNATATALDMNRILLSEEDSMARLAVEKEALAAYKNSPILESISNVIDIISKQTEAGARIAKGYLIDMQGAIIAGDKILTSNYGTFRNSFIEKLQSSKFLQSMAEKNGKMTAASFHRIIQEEGQQFRSILKTAITENITGQLPVGVFGKRIDEAIETAVNEFVTTLRSDANGGLKQYVDRINIDLTDNADKLAEGVQAVEEQKQLFDKILEPLLRGIGKEVADVQSQLIHTQTRALDLWGRCLENPARMSEIILGDITMTYMPSKGASASIENLAGFSTEYQSFLKALDLSDEAERGVEPLREWAFRESNIQEIQDAIVDRWAFINGKMTEEEKLKYKPNSRAGRVALAYLDNLARMRANLYNVGSGKQDLVSFFDPSKLRNAAYYLNKQVFGTAIYQGVTGLSQAENKAIANAFARFLPRSSHKEDMAYANLAMHLFSQLDLDKHFNDTGLSRVSLNEVRDALLEGAIPGQGSPLDRLVFKHGEKNIEKAAQLISEGFWGNDLDMGLINRLHNGSNSISAEMAGHKAKFLEDLKPQLHYKSLVAQKEDLASFGYDNMKSWYEADMGKAKKAYAVLSKAGSEPFQFYESMKEIARTYANKVAPNKHGIKNAKVLQDSVGSDRFESALRFAVNTVCGTYTIPASQGVRIAQLAVRVLSAPMLMKAGWKSLSDYNYQFQDLVTMGLSSGADFGTRARIASRLVKSFTTDRSLHNRIYLNQLVSMNSVYEKVLNNPMWGMRAGEMSRAAGKQGAGQLNEYAPNLLKAESYVKGYSDFILNNFWGAWIGPMTERNRSNAAIQIMQSVAEFATEGNTWKNIAGNNRRLIQTLERYGINEFEWDNILSKDCIMGLDDYIKKYQKFNTDHFGNAPMFFPDLVAELSDEQIAGYLKAQAKPVTERAIQMYRQNLVDKAAMLVNVGADEMTSIPTARIQGALFVGHNPNTWAGFGFGSVLQFQTFGAAVNYYHWGRRLATHMVQGDETFNKFLMSVAWQSAAPDMLGYISELALSQYFINEAISEVSGTNRRLYNDAGQFQGDALVGKIGKAYSDQLGFFGPALDAVITGVTSPRGMGGGIALPVLPSASSATKKVGRIYDAATKESVKGHRGKAIAGAVIQDVAEMTGIPNQPLLQAAWSLILGDTLTEWQKGNTYNKYMRQRRKKGYGPSWLQYGWDTGTSLFTN